MPYKYGNEKPEVKYFVLLCHERHNGSWIAIFLKATSQTAIYENRPEMMAGVAYYVSGEVAFFPANTAVQPDNLHPIPHAALTKSYLEGQLKVMGSMPNDFREKITAAADASVTMKPDRKKNFLARL
jgi:hypothetical protein